MPSNKQTIAQGKEIAQTTARSSKGGKKGLASALASFETFDAPPPPSSAPTIAAAMNEVAEQAPAPVKTQRTPDPPMTPEERYYAALAAEQDQIAEAQALVRQIQASAQTRADAEAQTLAYAQAPPQTRPVETAPVNPQIDADWGDIRSGSAVVNAIRAELQGQRVLPSSRYTDPETPEGQVAAAAAARSAGMGAAAAGMGGGATPPPRPPGSGLPPPDPDRPDRPAPPVLAGDRELPNVPEGWWQHFKEGWKAQAGKGTYADSVPGDTVRRRAFPEIANSSAGDKAAFLGGRVIGDVVGYGTRKLFWNMNPEDAMGTAAREVAVRQGLNPVQAQLARAGTATALGLVSGNYNPLNFAQGGRGTGFSAANPTDEDPRESENPLTEMFFDRMMLGRTGRILPWEQFHEERPDVPYAKYAAYQDYLKSPAALGLVKGTMDGIDGPEARIVGYRVQPEGVAAALAAGAGIIAGFKYMR